MIDPKHLDWCRNLFASLNEGGVWAVPRSGLIFNKRGNTFVLVARMPWMDDMPITAKQLKRQQDGDIAVITLHFSLIGVAVIQGNNDNDKTDDV